MYGMGTIVDAGWCSRWGIFCGDGSATMGIPAPTQPAVPPGAYQPGNLTGNPQSILNSIIDPSAAQDRANLTSFFGGVNAANVAGEPAPTDWTSIALLAGAAALIFIGGR